MNKPEKPVKEYLADSVYANIDEYGDVVITTENGAPTDPSNRIVLEPFTAGMLMGYLMKYHGWLRSLNREGIDEKGD